jgi:beta-ureidopropionase
MSAQETKRKRIAPYMAVGLSSNCRAITKRSDSMNNLRDIENCIHSAIFLMNIELPVKLVALPEGAISGLNSEQYWPDHVSFARECAIDIPGEETDFLGELARHYETYIIAQAKAKWPEVIKDRFFNTAFLIDPNGKVIWKSAKNHIFAREHSCTPHDIYDVWVKKFGDGIDAFYPVCKTEDIGNIGGGVCGDGVMPEYGRALALNGAEIIYRPSFPEPWVGTGAFRVQNRAHALFNNCYVIAPQSGYLYMHPDMKEPVDTGSGDAHIVDYLGNVISFSAIPNSIIGAIFDIEQLRSFKERALFGNFIKDLRTEIFKKMYEKPIHPKNLCIDKPPMQHADGDEILRDNIKRLQERGVYTPPAEHFEGAKYIPAKRNPIKLPKKK